MIGPTKDDIAAFVKTVDDLAVFAAIHGAFNKPTPPVMAVMNWLRSMLNESKDGKADTGDGPL